MIVRYPNLLYYTFVLLAFFGPLLSYITYRAIVPLCTLAALSSLISLGPRRVLTLINRLPLAAKLLSVVFFLWFFGTTIWAPNSPRGLLSAVKFLGTCSVIFCLVVGAMHLNANLSKKILTFLGLSISGVIFLLIIDIISNGMISMVLFNREFKKVFGFYWFKPVVTLVALGTLVIGYTCWCNGKKILSSVITIAIFFMVIFFNSKTLGVAIPACFLAAMVLVFCGKHRIKILIGALATSTFLLVANIGNTFTAKDVSSAFPNLKRFASNAEMANQLSTFSLIHRSTVLAMVHRIYIWEFSIDLIKQKPIYGWGLGASRYLGNEQILIDQKNNIWGELLPLHSHNFTLQVWLETGLIGLILLLGVIYIILSKIDQVLKLSFSERTFLLTIVLTFIALWYLNYGSWTSWWLHQIGFILAMMVLSVQNRQFDK